MKSLWAILISAVALSFAAVIADHHEKKAEGPKSASPGNRIFEMRTYYTHPGKLEDLHKRFREHTNGIFVKHGMTLVGYWIPVDQEDTLTYILAYPNMEARQAAWKGFRDDPAWKQAFQASRENGPIVKKVDSQFMVATDYSPFQ